MEDDRIKGLVMFISASGAFYVGDMLPGDREATAVETAAYDAKQVTLSMNGAKAQFLFDREKMLNRFSGMVNDFNTAASLANAANTQDVANALLSLLSDTRVIAATDLPALKLAMKTRYNEIMALIANAEVKAAYAKRDA
jgi:lysophospholipase L1-like esterase